MYINIDQSWRLVSYLGLQTHSEWAVKGYCHILGFMSRPRTMFPGPDLPGPA